MKLDDEKMAALGLEPSHMVIGNAVMQYVAGCVLRERERLARAVEQGGSPAELAARIRSESDDDRVFKWAGASTSLDAPPVAAPRVPASPQGQS
jgi:hypothetical protein